MTKTKKYCILIMIVSIVSITIGLFIGKIAFSKSVENKDVDCSHPRVEASADNDYQYPFSPYKSFLTNGSGTVISDLNDNPIDKMYYKKYINCSLPEDEQDVLSDWNKAYEDEFNNAKKVLKTLISEKSNDYDMPSKDVLSTIEDYVNSCSTYTESAAQLAYDFEEFNLGCGTNHVYNLLNNSLEINRMNTLRLIECIYMLDESYTWLK